MDTVGDFYLAKVEEEPERKVKQIQEAQELRLVDRQHFLDILKAARNTPLRTSNGEA